MRAVYLIPEFTQGLALSNLSTRGVSADKFEEISNPLLAYFEAHEKGHGIWKWEHYFGAYHRHLAKFQGESVNLLEVGIYSGGSLDMWLSYFGEKSRIYGVDIEETCKSYERDNIKVFIGDQEDRFFWRKLKDSSLPKIHVLIDDGGHKPEQQIWLTDKS